VRYVFPIAIVVLFLLNVFYAVGAQWLRDYSVAQTERSFGPASPVVRLQKWFVSTPFYLPIFRFVAIFAAACLLWIMVYLMARGCSA